MNPGIVVIFISGVWALILLVRVQSILGQKFFIISGNNMFNAKGIALSDGAYLILWMIAIGGFCFGAWLIANTKKTMPGSFNRISTKPVSNNLPDKKCPACAEIIKFEATKCKHCGEVFDKSEVEKQISEYKISEDNSIKEQKAALRHEDDEKTAKFNELKDLWKSGEITLSEFNKRKRSMSL